MRGSEPQQAYILNKHCWQQSDLKSDYSIPIPLMNDLVPGRILVGQVRIFFWKECD